MRVRLPDELKRSAYAADNGELAWSRDDALKVIEWATSQGIGLLGAEVWIPTLPGPTVPAPFFYAVSIDPFPSETTSGFVQRANAMVRDYVARFQWHEADHVYHGRNPHFNLTFVDDVT